MRFVLGRVFCELPCMGFQLKLWLFGLELGVGIRGV
jgi:hypothetical protein